MEIYNGHPAINVKLYQQFGPDRRAVMARFSCGMEVADKALEYAFESSQEQFWEDAKDFAVEKLGYECFQEGRSGGWLVVPKIPEPQDWDDEMRQAWDAFEKGILDDIAYRCQPEVVMEDIEVNRWAEEGAERYNFLDTINGPRCIADWNRKKESAIATAWLEFIND